VAPSTLEPRPKSPQLNSRSTTRRKVVLISNLMTLESKMGGIITRIVLPIKLAQSITDSILGGGLGIIPRSQTQFALHFMIFVRPTSLSQTSLNLQQHLTAATTMLFWDYRMLPRNH